MYPSGVPNRAVWKKPNAHASTNAAAAVRERSAYAPPVGPPAGETSDGFRTSTTDHRTAFRASDHPASDRNGIRSALVASTRNAVHAIPKPSAQPAANHPPPGTRG